MDGPEIDVIIGAQEQWSEADAAFAEAILVRAFSLSGLSLDGPAELSVLLTNDAAQRQLNREWRGLDKSTNVLSFPQIDPDGPAMGLLGDISLARETLEEEAGESAGPRLEAHFAHLLVHGLLHIFGYDHQTEDEALAMEGKETDIMGSLGYDDPYAGTDPA
ncbi:rRNA maturation RNase YbeY [Pelagibacterium montanilacus]|uniref:rRNA maturation RNase YbeY n=1 Tax=Pelagibacterium montanilacus TaxID=2185280 RepID=UPI000F8DD648|nr:rRNA maturation RNase YbeY [Pelagibacterium montanilacus]